MHYQHEFPQPDHIVHLNHAGVAPWPQRTAQAIAAFAEENATQGPVRYDQWLTIEMNLRAQLRDLLNAPSSDDIALVKNTSEALSMVAYGIDWRPGDNVVIPDQEFPSNRIVWESLRPRGVEVRPVALDQGESPEQALINQVDEHTRLISVSSVQYATGLRMDLLRLGEFCRDNNILFCVDAIQSVGAMVTDVQAIHADYAMADGHKWLLAPEGLGFFYCRAERRNELQLSQYGWHMVEHQGDYDRTDWQPAGTARRFECGSPNMLGIHGLSASISWLSEIGLDNIQRIILKKAEYLIDYINNNPELILLTPSDRQRHAGIVTFRHKTCDTARLQHQLRQNNVLCAARGGGIRFSPHFYISESKLNKALECVDRLTNARQPASR